MTKDEFDKMQSRRRRRGNHAAAHAACPFNRPPARGLFGATLPTTEVLNFALCVTFYGGQWCAYTSPFFNDGHFAFLATTNFCGGFPCSTDHRVAGRKLLADLEKFLVRTPRAIRVLHSPGWPRAGYRRRTG